jgi:Pro-kumamolisin, activation domain/Bacterial Ig-like domain (group 3)
MMKQVWPLMVFLVLILSATPGRLMAQSSGPTVFAAGGKAPGPVANKTAQLLNHVEPEQKLRLILGLQHPNPDGEEKFVSDLQNRQSADFHHFLTAEQWNARFSPSESDEQAVVDWANGVGLTVTQRYANRLLVDVEGSVATIERALDLSINRYQLGAKSFFSNDRDPSIPASLGGILHSIGGLNSYEVLKSANNFGHEQEFPMYSEGATKVVGPAGHDDGDATKLPASSQHPRSNQVTPLSIEPYAPTDLYTSYAYNTSALHGLGHCCNPLGNSGVTPPESSIAIAAWGVNKVSDFEGWHRTYPYLADHYQIYYIDGTPTVDSGEGTLDFEWATAMANNFGPWADTAMVYIYEGVDKSSGTYTDVFNQMLSDGLARVMTNSHYYNENDFDQGTMDTWHGIFNAMLGQGWTLVAISGDGGATTDCKTTSVAWPGSDPDMLTVGGTTMNLDLVNLTPTNETGWMGGTSPKSCLNNDGGSGGGCSNKFSAPGYQGQFPECGSSSRSVPDVALNADSDNTPQMVYVNGQLGSVGGTSIGAPEMAGFFAQENAYLLYVGAGVGNHCYDGNSPCAPLGQPNQAIYYEGFNSTYAPHYPFYDITSGCNSNDITVHDKLTYYCAGTGYDLVTGWGSVNMLQLAWLFNTWAAYDGGAPLIQFQGPIFGHWYNSDQGVFWLATDKSGTGAFPIGLAGFTARWDVDPGNIVSDSTRGCCDSYFDGPKVTTTSLGDSFVSAAGQGCHTLHVRAWDDSGLESADDAYGPVCYDTIAPYTTDTLSGTLSGGTYKSAVKVTLTASDPSPGSGISFINYEVNTGFVITYSGPFTVSSAGANKVLFYSEDVAGNQEKVESVSFSITSTTTTSLSSSLNPAPSGKPITFTAIVAPKLSGTPTGTVTFKDGATVLGTKTLSGGKATFSTSALASGSHNITAIYDGATYFTTSTSSALAEKIANTTSTKVASSKNPSMFGQSVTFTATVTHTGSGTPTGTVTFKNGGSVLGTATLSGGIAKFATATLTVATHTITAVYAGTPNFAGSTSPALSQVVDRANSTTTIKSSMNPSKSGESVTITATVRTSTAGTLTGTVNFVDNGKSLGTRTLSDGFATVSTAAFATGTHNITAIYAGNADFNGSDSANLKQVVNP